MLDEEFIFCFIYIFFFQIDGSFNVLVDFIEVVYELLEVFYLVGSDCCVIGKEEIVYKFQLDLNFFFLFVEVEEFFV